MSQMNHEQHHHEGHTSMSPSEQMLMNMASGTSQNPDSWRMPMLMTQSGGWHLMFMANWFVSAIQQTGPRGDDKVYAPNWNMIGAFHKLGSGAVMIQSMISLDPVTISNRSYPLLFQTGETAYGKPLVDAQHPHNFVMSLAVAYVRPLSEKTLFHLYFAPVGDPALGPVAFPHRASAMELPQATIGHHWQDSTHIADDVITAGVTYNRIRLEASGFHGREPDENRWKIGHGAIDSWSTRLTLFPSKNWLAQVSVGRLKHPEALEPNDVTRATASLHYTRGAWSSSLIYGHSKTHSFTAESVAEVGRKNFVTGRIEWVEKDELFPQAHATGQAPAYLIGAFTGGYTREFGSFRYIRTGLGANVTAYAVPRAIQSDYSAHPLGVNVFLRVRLQK